MRKLPKATSLVLAMLMLAACGETSAPEADTAADTAADAVTTEAGYQLPEADLGGETFKILLRSTSFTPEDIWAESENGDTLNDAVYRRNRQIEEDYNVKLFAEVASEATGAALNAYVTSFIMAGEAAYDLCMLRVSDMATLARSGLFVDLMGEENLDLTQPFWQYDRMMDTTVAGRLYYTTGLISNAANAMNVCFFNKDIAASYKMESLYDSVKAGTWTIDKLQTLAAGASKDLDGDGKMTAADQFGIAAQPQLSRMLLYASDEIIIGKDKDDIPYLAIGTERSFSVMDRIQKVMEDTENFFFDVDTAIKEVWFGERALFFFASMQNAKVMRGYDFEFGVLPLPKYDEAQEEYMCYLNAHNPCGTGIPVTADSSRAALMLQALAYYSEDTVIPAYYDVCLEGKYLRDNESAEMLDIIFQSWVCDLSDAYQWVQISGQIVNAMNSGSGVASVIESNRSPVEAAIAETVKAYNSFA